MVELLWITAALAQAPAAEPVAEPAPGISVAWELPAGSAFSVVQETTTSVQTPLGAQSTLIGVTSRHAVTAGGTLGEDAIAWDEQVLGQRVAVDMAGQKLAWSSADKQEDGEAVEPPAGFEALPLLLQGTWVVQVGADLGVKVVGTLPEQTLDKAAGAGLSEADVARFLGDDSVAGALVDQLGSLPRGALTVGDSRSSTLEIDVPGIGALPTTHTLVLDRVQGGEAIFVETLTAPDTKGEAVEVRRLSGKGELSWDIAGARPLVRTMDIGFDVVVPGEEAPLVMPTRVTTFSRIEAL